MPTTQTALDNLPPEFGLDMLSEEERNELLEDLGEMVFEGAMRRTWDALDADKQDALTALLEASTSDPENDDKRTAIQTFIAEHVPEFDSYVTAEVEELKTLQQRAYEELSAG